MEEQEEKLEKKIFGPPIQQEVTNFSTGEKYTLCGGEEMPFSEKDIDKIAKICSQKNIYDMLFAKRLEGRPYTDKEAQGFIDWLKDGWKNQMYFVFIVRKSDGEIIGAIDIKSADLERAEVGYWADENYRGFMTNTVKQLCSLAKGVGFVKLFAGVRFDNGKSIGVLERAGFVLVDKNPKEKDHIEYEKQL